jgi:hypothetical protein
MNPQNNMDWWVPWWGGVWSSSWMPCWHLGKFPLVVRSSNSWTSWWFQIDVNSIPTNAMMIHNDTKIHFLHSESLNATGLIVVVFDGRFGVCLASAVFCSLFFSRSLPAWFLIDANMGISTCQ